MTNNAIKLTKGTQREYLTVGIGGDEIQNARQIVDLSNNTSTLEFDLETASRKWTFFEGMELDAEARGRKYCIWGEDTITKARDNSGTHLHVRLKETWYKLEKKYLTAYNINVETSDFDHIDKNMVVLHGNSPDPLYINGTRVTCPYTVGTAQYHFWCVLHGTGWTLDTRYAAFWPDGKFDLESDKKHVLENIDILQKFYGGMLLWDSANKRVALVDEAKYQVYEGFDIRYRKNIISIERKEDRNIITRLYVYGNSNLNIAAVNGNKEYIDNFSYTGEILEDVIQNGDIYDTEGSTDGQQRLLAWGKRESAFYAKPRYTYTVDIFKYKYQENKAIPQPELAKLAKVVDEDIAGTPTLQRILKIDQNVFVENDCKVVVGDILRTFAGKFKDLNADADKAGNTISGTGQVSGGVVRGKSPALVKSEYELNSSISRTETMLRSEISTVDGNLRSVITQTATSIKTEVQDVKNGLQSSITQTASQIRLEVSNIEAGLRSTITQTAGSITAQVNAVDGRVSAVKITADGVSAEVREARGNYSSLKLRADSIVSSVSAVDGRVSTVKQTADDVAVEVRNARGSYSSLNLRVNSITSEVFDGFGSSRITQTADRVGIVVDNNKNVKASIIVKAINDESSVSINANRINLTGYVTISSLGSSGSTTIDGSRITTGTISASRITSDFSSIERLTIKNLQVNGDIFWGTANGALKIGGQAQNAGVFFFGGSQVKTKSISGQTGNFLYT